jgi:hypothetical protein
MASSINASTSGAGGVITTADNTGILQLQTAGVTAVTVNASSALGVGTSPSYGTSGQVLTSAGTSAAPTWSTISAGATTLKTITDTTDITLVNVASSYVTVGSSFSVSIPTTGFIRVGSFAGRLTYSSGGNETALVFGIRIGATNYWLGTWSRNGTTKYSAITTFITGAGYEEYAGPPRSYGSGVYGLASMVSDITATSIPTGTQTVQLIAAADVASYAGISILKGTTTTTRVGLEFVSAS